MTNSSIHATHTVCHRKIFGGRSFSVSCLRSFTLVLLFVLLLKCQCKLSPNGKSCAQKKTAKPVWVWEDYSLKRAIWIVLQFACVVCDTLPSLPVSPFFFSFVHLKWMFVFDTKSNIKLLLFCLLKWHWMCCATTWFRALAQAHIRFRTHNKNET